MQILKLVLLPILFAGILACVSKPEADSQSANVSDAQDSPYYGEGIAWAVNIGGPSHRGKDGIFYAADQLQVASSLGQIDTIKGAQEPAVYQSYRLGVHKIQQPLPNGEYDIVLRFAEPEEVPIGGRIFDVMAENKIVIPSLDVRSARDGNIKSSLDRAVVNVEVQDGKLDLEFVAKVGEPILNAIVVMRKERQSLSAWELAWSDEFELVGAPDPAKWTHDIWPSKKVNDEDQAYTNDSRNIRVVDGKLIIEAHLDDGHYTSARIHSAGKGDLLYGRVDVRAKLPVGQGTWPAIWMLPTDPFKYATTCSAGADWQGSSSCDAWPNSGEIDIMEHVGYDENRVHGTVHTKAFYWVNGEQRKASVETQSATSDYHVYSLEWSEDRIDIYFDDVRYFTYLKQSDKWQEWPFGHPFHLILNLAVGGGWGSAGGPTDESAFPARMEVDYVRVYKPIEK